MISANIPNETRRQVYKRDGYRCALCDDTRYLQVHHYVHRSLGGSNHVHNLITLCSKCHALAHGTNLFDFAEISQEDIEQACVEYLADYYAPDWNPYCKGCGP